MAVYNDPNNYWLPPQGKVIIGSPQGRAVVGNSSGPAATVAQDGNNMTITGTGVGNCSISWSDGVNTGSFTVYVTYSQIAGYSPLETTAPLAVRLVPDQEWM